MGVVGIPRHLCFLDFLTHDVCWLQGCLPFCPCRLPPEGAFPISIWLGTQTCVSQHFTHSECYIFLVIFTSPGIYCKCLCHLGTAFWCGKQNWPEHSVSCFSWVFPLLSANCGNVVAFSIQMTHHKRNVWLFILLPVKSLTHVIPCFILCDIKRGSFNSQTFEFNYLILFSMYHSFNISMHPSSTICSLTICPFTIDIFTIIHQAFLF